MPEIFTEYDYEALVLGGEHGKTKKRRFKIVPLLRRLFF